jgi:hypothetical protein
MRIYCSLFFVIFVLSTSSVFAFTNNASGTKLAYNGAFVKTKLSNEDEREQAYLIERGKEQGAKLIKHALSELLLELNDATDKKEQAEVFAKANAEQKQLYVIYQFRELMAKGGFQAYFRSDAGNSLPQLKKALIAVHANQYLLVLNKAVKAFADDPHVLDETFGRNQVLDEMDEFERFTFFEAVDGRYQSLEDDELLLDRMARYLNQHANHFFAKAD